MNGQCPFKIVKAVLNACRKYFGFYRKTLNGLKLGTIEKEDTFLQPVKKHNVNPYL